MSIPHKSNYANDPPWIDIEFSWEMSSKATFGTEEFAREVYDVVRTGNARGRFKMAEQLCRVIAKELIFDCPLVSWPIYNVTSLDSDPEEVKNDDTLCLGVLPNFRQPARQLVFFRAYDGSLQLWQLQFLTQPEYAAIDPKWFRDRYRIDLADHVGYRAAVIEVLKERGKFSDLITYPAFDYRDEDLDAAD